MDSDLRFDGMRPEVRLAIDAALEEDGFELLVRGRVESGCRARGRSPRLRLILPNLEHALPAARPLPSRTTEPRMRSPMSEWRSRSKLSYRYGQSQK